VIARRRNETAAEHEARLVEEVGYLGVHASTTLLCAESARL
jgi:hypothetical protein